MTQVTSDTTIDTARDGAANGAKSAEGIERINQSSTLLLRAAVIALGAVALLISGLVLPAIWQDWATEYHDAAGWRIPLLVILSATLVPFFTALAQTWKLLQYVDKQKAFSELAVNALKRIKYAALVFSGLYIVILPAIYTVAQHVDAPGVMVIGLVMVAAPVVIAGFAAVLQQLLHNAIALKVENDLTV